MKSRKLAATLLAGSTIVAASVFGLAGSASAAPNLGCRYGHICGWDANGHSFDYYRCGHIYKLPNMVGRGLLEDNETPGTVAIFYHQDMTETGRLTAPDQLTVDWAAFRYLKAC